MISVRRRRHGVDWGTVATLGRGAWRSLVVFAGGYFIVNGLVGWGARALQVVNMSVSESFLLMLMLGVLLYLGLLVWGFSDRNLARVSIVNLCGAALMLFL
ncbi:MAG: hypothetical protein AAGA95_06820 [Pseudomonadota bacterium]